MNGRGAASARTCFGKPVKVLELAALATVISPSILVVTTSGTSQVLSQDGSEGLPLVYVLLAVVSIPLASGISAALGRWPTSCICRLVCWASLFLCLALRAALAVEAPGAPQAICISAYVLEILFDTLFWLSVSEYLTTLELKRHAPFLAMAFGVGGILGGLLATGFCARLPADDLLLLNAALFGVCLIQFRRINRTLPALQADTDGEQEAGIVTAVRSTFVVLRAFPLTAAIAAGIFLMSSLFCLQDYLALTIYAENIVDEDSLASFMALSFAGQQVAELLILAVFGKVVLERAGPLVRNLFFPLTTIAVLLALQELWVLPDRRTGPRQCQRGFQCGIRTGQEPELRRPTLSNAGTGEDAAGGRRISGGNCLVRRRVVVDADGLPAERRSRRRHHPVHFVRRDVRTGRDRVPAEPTA